VGESRMKQGQQQGDARRRQAQAAEQGPAEAEQEDQFEMAETREILRSPFDDQAKGRTKSQNITRGGESAPAIGMDQRRQQAEQSKASPAKDQAQVVLRRAENGFPGEKGRQHEGEQE